MHRLFTLHLPLDLHRPAPRAALAAALLGTLAGCGTPRPAPFERESFGSTSTYSRAFAAAGGPTCEAARRALLSQGYIVDTAKADVVQGHKNFQPAAETHTQILFNIVCTSEDLGGRNPARRTLVFVNAVQERYALKKSNSSASVGVGMIGAVSVPFTSSDDSMVKVASETVTSGDFYGRLFGLIDRYLAIGAGQAVEEPAVLPQVLQPVPSSVAPAAPAAPAAPVTPAAPGAAPAPAASAPGS